MESKKKKRAELLAPARNFMAIKASGPYADAIYFGVQQFNMRMNAQNFLLSELPKVVERCHNPREPHFRKRKAYLTTNVLVYEEELEELQHVIGTAKDAGVDAVIVHDFAAIKIAKKEKIPFHISTQCNVSNSIAAQAYEEMGAERIILAREVSLEQMKKISQKLKKAELEAFIHGAMCSSISGRCYLSQTIYGGEQFSANRGRCAQPCRGEWTLLGPKGSEFIYDGLRIFNSRDLCMIHHIPEVIEAGIMSLKIEGRMRHPHYVETVTQVYREAIDAYYNGQFEQEKKKRRWLTRLKQVYNRGFTTGFYFHEATVEDSQLHNPSNMSHYRYIEMGKIVKFFPKSQTAAVDIINGSLKKGDKIIIMSSDRKHETYFQQNVSDIRIDGKEIERTSRGTPEKPIKIVMKVKEPVNGKNIDRIYKFTDETYQGPNKNTETTKNVEVSLSSYRKHKEKEHNQDKKQKNYLKNKQKNYLKNKQKNKQNKKKPSYRLK